MTFIVNRYQVIKKAVSFDLANFIYNYFLLKRDAVKWMYDNNIIYDNGMFGTWTDEQVPNTYSHYADMVMETLMMKVLPVMRQETGLELIPTYSYARLYKKGDILRRHKDRPSCEISTTLNPFCIKLNDTDILISLVLFGSTQCQSHAGNIIILPTIGLTLTSLHKCFGGSPFFLAGIAMCDVDLGSLKTISPESFVALI